MSATLERFCRVGHRPIGGGTSLERTNRLDFLSPTGVYHSEPSAANISGRGADLAVAHSHAATR